MDSLHNTHLFHYPHKQGVWRELGLIVGERQDIYPKLFRLVGYDMITWKDELNADDARN